MVGLGLNSNMVETDKVSSEEMEFIQELLGYKFSNKTYQIYKHNTEGNMNLEYDAAKRKLIRNIILGNEAPAKEGLEYKKIFYYGNLQVHINLNEERICYIKNFKHKDFEFEVDEEKKSVLNEILGIESTY